MKIKVEELTHAFLQKFCDFECNIALINHFHTDWEADILMINNDGFSHEIEIKLSKADFKNDFKKSYTNQQSGEKFLKHDKISCGDYVCNHFSFLFPMGMVEAETIPKHCGIIEFYHNPDSWETTFYEIRKPAKIHEDSYWKLVDKGAFTRILARNLLFKKFQLKGKSEELIFKMQEFQKK
ncbi:hypothetical protein [Frigoriflavimonas asaccharolytica]|uniref:Uncharacterized protein n=1 Tax=Frigoriflavimonas asaccharolytica TaxID=2735899 RepID=A0A8J8KAX4_9FLAO|nr:hypothetical protein [Frigoriflavimonas asaccharolytica]NRS91939.1 hypothetical protein [Frigoriflavimonas asaccharolytica]